MSSQMQLSRTYLLFSIPLCPIKQSDLTTRPLVSPAIDRTHPLTRKAMQSPAFLERPKPGINVTYLARSNPNRYFKLQCTLFYYKTLISSSTFKHSKTRATPHTQYSCAQLHANMQMPTPRQHAVKLHEHTYDRTTWERQNFLRKYGRYV